MTESLNHIPQDLDTYLAEIEAENHHGDVAAKDIARMVAIIRHLQRGEIPVKNPRYPDSFRPEQLVGAIHDTMHRDSEKLIASGPIKPVSLDVCINAMLALDDDASDSERVEAVLDAAGVPYVS